MVAPPHAIPIWQLCASVDCTVGEKATNPSGFSLQNITENSVQVDHNLERNVRFG